MSKKRLLQILILILFLSFSWHSSGAEQGPQRNYIFHFFVRYVDLAINDGNVQVCAFDADDAKKKAYEEVHKYSKKYGKKVEKIDLQFMNNTGTCNCPGCGGLIF